MRALVIGGSGQIGGSLLHILEGTGADALGTWHRHPMPHLLPLDIEDQGAVDELVADCHPAVVYLCSALTAVDYCEGHQEEAWKINVRGTEAVARAAARTSAKLVFFSTEYVFDGVNGPYAEDDPICPVSIYGRTKADGEQVLQALISDLLIIRTTVVYSWNQASLNFAMQVWQRLSAGQTVRVPDDQVGNPTLASYLAEATVRLVGRDSRGIINVVGLDRVPRSEFALRLSRALGFGESLIEAVPSSELSQAAPRPLQGGLRTDRLAGLLGIPQSLDEGIDRFARAARVAGPA